MADDIRNVACFNRGQFFNTDIIQALGEESLTQGGNDAGSDEAGDETTVSEVLILMVIFINDILA